MTTKPDPKHQAFKHGESGTRAYLAHRNLKQAVFNPNSSRYPNVGGAGVTIPAKWLTFEGFIAAVGLPPDKETSVPLRKNIDQLAFSKANFVWGTAADSRRKQANVSRYMYKGKWYTVAELAEMAGIRAVTMQSRLRDGWDIKRAMETPVRG